MITHRPRDAPPDRHLITQPPDQMTQISPTTFPGILVGDDDDIADLANKLIAETGMHMLQDGCRADEISYMRRDIVTTVSTYAPQTFRRAS